MSMNGIAPLTLKNWLDRDLAVLIDVREGFEYADEFIDESVHMPLSAFDLDGLPDHKDRIVVYTCASGARTARYAAQLKLASAGAPETYHLEGGLFAWKEAGLPMTAGPGADLPDAMPHFGAMTGQGAPCAPAG
ncbi:MAG: rhodanese-like domain-containing protein [Rhodospirillales bacterium]|nr:rhodanese-like domain-containing protein [Rhodospirillales bacterium]